MFLLCFDHSFSVAAFPRKFKFHFAGFFGNNFCFLISMLRICLTHICRQIFSAGTKRLQFATSKRSEKNEMTIWLRSVNWSRSGAKGQRRARTVLEMLLLIAWKATEVDAMRRARVSATESPLDREWRKVKQRPTEVHVTDNQSSTAFPLRASLHLHIQLLPN